MAEELWLAALVARHLADDVMLPQGSANVPNLVGRGAGGQAAAARRGAAMAFAANLVLTLAGHALLKPIALLALATRAAAAVVTEPGDTWGHSADDLERHTSLQIVGDLFESVLQAPFVTPPPSHHADLDGDTTRTIAFLRTVDALLQRASGRSAVLARMRDAMPGPGPGPGIVHPVVTDELCPRAYAVLLFP